MPAEVGALRGRPALDLGCASLLALLVDPDHPDMAYPKPMPERVAEFLARFAPHAGAQWVLAQYARHRPAACAAPPPA